MSQNTDRLLDGYQVRAEEPVRKGFGHGQSPLNEGESYTISDKPNRFVCSLFDYLERFEEDHPNTIGRLYMLFTTLIVTFLFAVKQEVLPHLPAIEVIFVSFLITFVFNYYLMNGALFKPFMDDSQNSFTIKLCGAYAVGAVACFFYGLNFLPVQTAVAIFYTSFFLAVIFDVVFLKENYKQNELLFALGSLAGAIITIMGSNGQLWPSDVPAEASSMTGIILSAVSAILVAMIMMNFGKMNTENFTTMTHIFTLMIVLFTPMFFPIQGVVTPNMNQWIVLVFCGLLTAIATLFFIRSFQIENGARTAVFLSLSVALIFVIEMIFNKVSGAAGIVGVLITAGCVFKYHQEFESKHFARKSMAEQEAAGQELNEIRRSG